ncbi:hypothetical protein [Microbacterium sp. NIBRBAC000506063]|uniref:hypothetical protein n=1 Tax=Microbacterium sp. NIBRBAC000506063 TaxID=2734618 RepID=UPI001BB4F60E|nr:hypothetical protein [Microbacterium sp. NIBRBAC000506063]QTV80544.1 hypothetical protein KAE78_06680 [Microbacterium sp. NIBRBAC000506063]
MQTQPTEEFVRVVQERVEEFLEECTTQRVLLPTACPFGFEVDHRITTEPEWSIARHPSVEVAPDGAHWQIPRPMPSPTSTSTCSRSSTARSCRSARMCPSGSTAP